MMPGTIAGGLDTLRDAARGLWRARRDAALVVLVLGLGVAACATVFALLDRVFVRPLPFPEPDRLVAVQGGAFQRDGGRLEVADWLAAGGGAGLEGAALYTVGTVNLAAGGEPERVRVAQVSPGFFAMLGRAPSRGRWLGAQDQGPRRAPVAVIGDRLWRRQLQGRPDVVGHTLLVGGQPFTVVGLMPPDFDFPGRAELWVTASLSDRLLQGGLAFWFCARLAPGVTPLQAQSRLRELAALQRAGAAPDAAEPPITLVPLQAEIFRSLRPGLLLLQGAALLVLLIGCANAANLLLAAAAARQGERAVRSALGARPAHIIAHAGCEALLLAAASAAFGLLLAAASVRVLAALFAEPLSRIGGVSLTGHVVAGAAALAAASCLAAALPPALRTLRTDVRAVLLHSAGGAGVTRRRALSRTLVVAQITLAMLLAAGLGVLVRSFQAALRVEPGFTPVGRLALEVWLAGPRYDSGEQRARFAHELRRRLAEVPGVARVGLTSNLPLSGVADVGVFDPRLPVAVEGASPRPPEQALLADYRVVSPEYFAALGVRLLSGRDFDEHDAGGRPVVIVNRRLAQGLWGRREPAHARVLVDGEPREVVGVVDDVRHRGPEEEPRPEVYYPYGALDSPPVLAPVIEAEGDPRAVASALRDVVRRLDPELPVSRVRTLDELLQWAESARRSALTLLGGFALLALTLAAVGLYALLWQAVTARRGEFALRMALGAEPGAVWRSVASEGARLAALGVALGLGVALAARRLVAPFVFGVQPADPGGLALAALVVFAVALLALIAPARAAARVDPAAHLHHP